MLYVLPEPVCASYDIQGTAGTTDKPLLEEEEGRRGAGQLEYQKAGHGGEGLTGWHN